MNFKAWLEAKGDGSGGAKGSGRAGQDQHTPDGPANPSKVPGGAMSPGTDSSVVKTGGTFGGGGRGLKADKGPSPFSVGSLTTVDTTGGTFGGGSNYGRWPFKPSDKGSPVTNGSQPSNSQKR